MRTQLNCQRLACYRLLLPSAQGPNWHKSITTQLGRTIKTLEKKPQLAAQYYLAQGILHMQNPNEQARAEYSLRIAIELDPNCGSAYLLTAEIDFNHGFFENAINNATKALERLPNNPDPYIIIGRIFFKKGFHQKAINHYAQALRLNPKHYEALVGMSEIYLARGLRSNSSQQFFEQTLVYLDQAKRFYPDRKEAKLIRAKLAMINKQSKLCKELLLEILKKEFDFEALKILVVVAEKDAARSIKRYRATISTEQETLLMRLPKLDPEDLAEALFMELLPTNSKGYSRPSYWQNAPTLRPINSSADRMLTKKP